MKKILIPLLLLTWSMVRAQTMTLEDFNQRFEEEIGKISLQRKEQQSALNRKYLAALLRLEAQAKHQGNLDLVQSVRMEIARVEQNEDLPEFAPPPPTELAEMQKMMNDLQKGYKKEEADSIVKLVDTLKGYTSSRITEATRSNNISEAIAWQNWEKALDDDPRISTAYGKVNQYPPPGITEVGEPENVHAALEGRPATIQEEKGIEFGDSPSIFRLGKEPDGNEKRIRSTTPSMQGAGHTQLTGTLILIEEKDINKSDYFGTNKKEKSLTYVPRLSISPLVGKRLDRCLVVFDLYKRGSGTKRSIIRTESILLPPLQASDRVVVDAGKYEYETKEYDSSFSSYDYKTSTEEEFYGFIVTIFDKDGRLIFQRASERVLNDYARETPPK